MLRSQRALVALATGAVLVAGGCGKTATTCSARASKSQREIPASRICSVPRCTHAAVSSLDAPDSAESVSLARRPHWPSYRRASPSQRNGNAAATRSAEPLAARPRTFPSSRPGMNPSRFVTRL